MGGRTFDCLNAVIDRFLLMHYELGKPQKNSFYNGRAIKRVGGGVKGPAGGGLRPIIARPLKKSSFFCGFYFLLLQSGYIFRKNSL